MPQPPAKTGFVVRGAELRGSQRYQTQLQAQVVNSLQQCASATVTDISSQGLRLEGTEQLVAVLFPKPLALQSHSKTQSASDSAVTDSDNSFLVRLVLPRIASSTPADCVELQCCSVYVLRVKRDWFRIGVYYQQINVNEGSRLEAFILSLER